MMDPRDEFEKAVNKEVFAQNEMWGEQNHPDVDQTLMQRVGGSSAERMAQEYEIPTADRARLMCELAYHRNELTWAHILIEEVCEAIEAFTINSDKAEYELLQCEAVLRNWRMAIARRNA